MAREDKVAVDLVDHQDDAVLEADVGDLGEFFLRPDAADGVVRAAEDEDLNILFLDLLLHLFEVDGIRAVVMQLAVYELAAVLLNGFGERIVDGLHHHNAFAGLRKGLYAQVDGVDKAGAQGDPLRIHGVAVTGGEPMIEGFEIVVQRIGVTEDAVVDALMQIGQDLVGEFKVHIRDPHGKQVASALALGTEVVFQTVRTAAVDDLVKIVLHVFSSLMQPYVSKEIRFLASAFIINPGARGFNGLFPGVTLAGPTKNGYDIKGGQGRLL